MRLLDKITIPRKGLTPKNFYTNEVFVFAGIAIIPGFLLAGVLMLSGQAPLVAISNMVFLFFLIFFIIIRINNRVYNRDKQSVEYLLMVNRMDTVGALEKFSRALPLLRGSDGGVIETEELHNLMRAIFGAEEPEITKRFLDYKGNILPWMFTLELDERERFYRYFLQQ